MEEGKKSGFTLRAIVTGVLLTFFNSIASPYNVIVIKGTGISADFSTGAALFFLSKRPENPVAFKPGDEWPPGTKPALAGVVEENMA